MRSNRFNRPFGNCRLFAAVAAVVVLAGYLTIGFAPPAQALPSFARQTGQPCGTCHTNFPGLTPFGRRFKLLGYTTGGGLYKTTPFSTNPGPNDAYGALRNYASRIDGNGDAPTAAPVAEKGWAPPVSMMAIAGFTHTQVPQIAPPTDPYKANDNTVLSPFSGFWGGAITSNVGAFVQVTYNAPGPVSGLSGNPSDRFLHTWTWDNTDFRYASTANIGGVDFIYGITANNNPTVQDPWNTTPAWGFPFAGPALAGTPAAPTLVDGGLGQRVAGVGVYTLWNDLLYLESDVYRGLNAPTLRALGQVPGDGDQTAAFVPYGRVALIKDWGSKSHHAEIGAYALSANVVTGGDQTLGF